MGKLEGKVAAITGAVGYSVKPLCDAIDTLMLIGSANAFAEKSPLQRRWRDANSVTSHTLRATDPVLEIYEHALLDVKGRISPVV